MPQISRENLRSGLMMAALLSLVLALLHPMVTLPRKVFDGIAIIDITQSMDVQDMRLGSVNNGVSATTTSRLEFVKEALVAAIPGLPCGSKLGLGVFTEYRTLLLLTPVEVCANATELQETVRNIEGRMAWSGNSEIAKGLYWALTLAAKQQDKPAVVFFTDGQEAPPINADNRLAFQGKVGEVSGVLAGVGTSTPQPIPKRDPEGRKIGYWDASEVNQVNPFARGAGEDPAPERAKGSTAELTNRDGATVSTMRSNAALLGATPGSEHMSSLRAAYLALLAGEVGIAYSTMQKASDVSTLFMREEVTQWKWRKTDINPPLAFFALLSLALYAASGIKTKG